MNWVDQAHAGAQVLGKIDEGEVGDVRARHLMDYWAHGEGAAKIGWGAPGDYDRCLVEVGKHVGPKMVHGLCANLHHKALGIWPATHAAAERGHKTARPGWLGLVDADLEKVGEKGFIHGWIYVGPHPSIGQLVHDPKLGRDGEITRLTNGRVHVEWHDTFGHRTGKRNSFQHIHDDAHRPGKLMQRHEHPEGMDDFSKEHAAAVAASRRKDHKAAELHYRAAAYHAPDDKTRKEMLDRANAAALRHVGPLPDATPPPDKPAFDPAAVHDELRGMTHDDAEARLKALRKPELDALATHLGYSRSRTKKDAIGTLLGHHDIGRARPARKPGEFSAGLSAQLRAASDAMPKDQAGWRAVVPRDPAPDISRFEADVTMRQARLTRAQESYKRERDLIADELRKLTDDERRMYGAHGIPDTHLPDWVENNGHRLYNMPGIWDLNNAKHSLTDAQRYLKQAERDLADARKVIPAAHLPVDPVTGLQMPTAELRAHYGRLMDAGRKAMAEVQDEFAHDPELVRLRTAGAEHERIRAHLAGVRNNLREAWLNEHGSTTERDAKYKLYTDANRIYSEHMAHPDAGAARQIRQRESEIIQQMIASHRDVGGHTHGQVKRLSAADLKYMIVSKGTLAARADAEKRLKEAEGMYPTDWVRHSDEAGLLRLTSSERAYQNDTTRILSMPKKSRDSVPYDGAYRDSTQQTVVHELGHRMEWTVPGLREMEFAFHRDAATQGGVVEAPQKLSVLMPGYGYESWEKAIKDRFADAYVGKTYEGLGRSGNDPTVTSWEVFQTGTEDLLGRSTRVLGNDDLQAFTLGALLTLGHRADSTPPRPRPVSKPRKGHRRAPAAPRAPRP